MRSVAYDHFYAYDELTDTLRTWTEEAPNLCALESIGESYEGRDIWLVTVTNTETGAHLDKPGFLIEANIHSMEWTGCTAALHLIHRLLAGHGKDDLVTRALDTRVFYVIPRLNPDGAERGLEERRFIRSSVRPYPREDLEDGLRVEDLDGDGRVLDMRVEDPNGAWHPHPDERKLLVRREPVDSPEDGPFYRLLAEGRIENYDGVTIKVPPPLEGLDLNRNFPADWAPEHEQRGAGPYPTSEPEVRAMVQAVTERPNITGHIAYHTFSGVHLRPYAGRRARQGRAGRLGHHQLLVQHSLRPAGGRGRAALGVGALPSPGLTSARGAVARRREAGGELVPGPPRTAELRLAADERDGESSGTEGRSGSRGRGRVAGGRPARRR